MEDACEKKTNEEKKKERVGPGEHRTAVSVFDNHSKVLQMLLSGILDRTVSSVSLPLDKHSKVLQMLLSILEDRTTVGVFTT